MAQLSRSNLMGFKKETTEGTLIELAAGAEFVKIREGASMESSVETLDSDELVAGSIGASKGFVASETGSISIPLYLKHSGVEGQAPQYGILIESALGNTGAIATEGQTVSSSTTSLIKGNANAGAYPVGAAVLVKDGTNGYSIRNIASKSSNDLTPNFNLSAAPASGVSLGKPVYYAPDTTIPTFSAHHYQNQTTSAFHQAMAGCRTQSMSIEIPASDFASVTFEAGSIKSFLNYATITSSNKYIDFKDVTAGAELTAILTEKTYNNPHELAREITSKMTAASTHGDIITCTYSNSTGKFTIATDDTYLDLLFTTGTNNANSVDGVIGFSGDQTGATTYTATSVMAGLSPAYTASFDSSDPLVIKNCELMLGDATDNVCTKAITASFTIDTPKTDIKTICAETGISESITNSREATFEAQIVLDAYQAGYFDKMINNTTTQLMANIGVKSAGNWVAGKCVNIYLANCSLTASTIAENEGYHVINISAKAFVTSSKEDVYINFL